MVKRGKNINVVRKGQAAGKPKKAKPQAVRRDIRCRCSFLTAEEAKSPLIVGYCIHINPWILYF